MRGDWRQHFFFHSTCAQANTKDSTNRRKLPGASRFRFKSRPPPTSKVLQGGIALNIGLSEENLRGCSGGEVMVGWWYGGCTKSCLCVSFSVVLVMILSLRYVGVHEDHHHGRSCARAFGFSIENLVISLVFEQKIKVVPARKT